MQCLGRNWGQRGVTSGGLFPVQGLYLGPWSEVRVSAGCHRSHPEVPLIEFFNLLERGFLFYW